MACRDTLRDDGTLGVLTNMNHLGTRISLLIVVGHSDTIELCLRIIATQDARRIFPSNGGTRFNLSPGEFRVHTTQIATFSYQIQHTTFTVFIARIPVLNG